MHNYNFKREWTVFWLFQKVQTKNWFKNYLNIFLGVFISLYTMLCWVGFKNGDPFLMISGICVVVIRNAMYCFLRNLDEWKDKSFWDRTHHSAISKTTKHASLIFFNITSTALIAGLLLAITLTIFPSQIDLLKKANHLMVWAGLVLLWVTCYITGLLVYQHFKNFKWANMVGLLLYFSSMMFLGLGFPFETITSIDWLNYLMYAHPFRYAVNIIQAGFVNSPNMIYSYIGTSGSLVTVDFGYNQIVWLPYVTSMGVILLFLVIYFARSRILLNLTKEHFKTKVNMDIDSQNYLKEIKLSTSVKELKKLRKQRKRMRN